MYDIKADDHGSPRLHDLVIVTGFDRLAGSRSAATECGKKNNNTGIGHDSWGLTLSHGCLVVNG